MEALAELQLWFQETCNGVWEHQFGVSIETLDNPGWKIQIDVCKTPLECMEFQEQIKSISSTDWFRCVVEEGVFSGYGGSSNLVELVEIFLAWATQAD